MTVLLCLPLVQTYSVARVFSAEGDGGLKRVRLSADLSLISNCSMNSSSISEKTDSTQKVCPVTILTAGGPNNTIILHVSFNSNLLLLSNLLTKVFLVDQKMSLNSIQHD